MKNSHLWYFNKSSKNLPLLYCCWCLEALRSLSCVSQHLSLFVYTADIYICVNLLFPPVKRNRQFQRSIYLTWCFSLLLTVSFQEWRESICQHAWLFLFGWMGLLIWHTCSSILVRVPDANWTSKSNFREIHTGKHMNIDATHECQCICFRKDLS